MPRLPENSYQPFCAELELTNWAGKVNSVWFQRGSVPDGAQWMDKQAV